MGTTSSAPAPTRLTEQDAWTIATAWHSKLYACICLDRDSPAVAFRKQHQEPPFSILRDIEYINLDFNALNYKKRRSAALAARAAIITWYVLSRCPGFSGAENPEFWAQVFTAERSLPAKYPGSTPSFTHTIESYRFFPNAAHTSVRVRVTVPEGRGKRAYRAPTLVLELLLLGAESSHLPAKEDRYLASVLRKLAPFVDASVLACEIPVVCRTPLNVDVLEIEVIRDVCENAAQLRNTASGSPVLRLTEVHQYSEYQFVHSETAELLDNTDLKFQLMEISGPSVALADVTQQFLHQSHISTSIDSKFRIETWALHSQQMDPDFTFVGKWCSILPHTRILSGLRVIDELDAFMMTNTNAAWLGYAIFHPDAAANKNSITNLKLGFRSHHRVALQIFAAMASGNNLLAGTDITSAMSSMYNQVKLRVGTSVRTHARENEGTTLLTCPSEVWVTACCTKVPQTKTTPIRVVFPGHGHTWISSDDILEVVERAPGESSVRRLCLINPKDNPFDHRDLDIATADFLESTQTILSVLGRRLEFLDLVTTSCNLSNATILSVLEKCPSLKSLRISHDGSCWSEANMAVVPEIPRLQELELIVDGTLQPLVARPLGNLKVFQVAHLVSESFVNNHRTFLSILESWPSIQSAGWHFRLGRDDQDDDQVWLPPPDISQFITRGIHDVAHGPMTLAARLAFLSVVCANKTSSLGHFTRDICQNVFSYSSSLTRRNVYISNNA